MTTTGQNHRVASAVTCAALWESLQPFPPKVRKPCAGQKGWRPGESRRSCPELMALLELRDLLRKSPEFLPHPALRYSPPVAMLWLPLIFHRLFPLLVPQHWSLACLPHTQSTSLLAALCPLPLTLPVPSCRQLPRLMRLLLSPSLLPRLSLLALFPMLLLLRQLLTFLLLLPLSIMPATLLR